MATVRVVSWNLHGLRDDRAAVLRVLGMLDPDVVCLQEVPRRPSTPGTRVRLRRLAGTVGLRLVRGGREAAGNALLVSSRIAVQRADAYWLPSPRWQAGTRAVAGIAWPRLRVGQKRGVVVAALTVADPAQVPQGDPGGARGIVVAAVHLGLDPAERVRHAKLIVELVEHRFGLPAVVAGDLNEAPGAPAWQVLAALVADPCPSAPPTFPARGPKHRIDAVLVSPGPAVHAYGVAEVSSQALRHASDHLPVVVDLSW